MEEAAGLQQGPGDEGVVGLWPSEPDAAGSADRGDRLHVRGRPQSS